MVASGWRPGGASVCWPAGADRYEAALALLGPARDDRAQLTERSWLLFQLAQARRYDNPAASSAYANDGIEIAGKSGDPALIAVLRWVRARMRSYLGENALDDLIDTYEAVRQLPDDALERIDEHWFGKSGWRSTDTQATHAQWLAVYGRSLDAVSLAESYLGEVVTDGRRNRGAEATARSALAIAYAALGRPEESLSQLARCLEVLLDIHDAAMATMHALARTTLLGVHYFADQPKTLCQWSNEAYAVLQEASETYSFLIPVTVLVPLQFIQGDWSEAHSVSKRASQHRTSLQVGGPFDERIYRCRIDLHQGRPNQARELLSDILPKGAETRPSLFGSSWIHLSLELGAEIALDAEDLETARAWIESHDYWLDWSDAVRGRAENQLLWARYHQIRGDLDEARNNAGRALVHATDPGQPLALVAADRFLGQLDVDEGKYDDAKGHLDASLELAERCESPFEQALTLVGDGRAGGEAGRG